MRKLVILGALIGFGVTFFSPWVAWMGGISLDTNKIFMTAGTIIWFACAPAVFNKKELN